MQNNLLKTIVAIALGMFASAVVADVATAQKLADKYAAEARTADSKWAGPTAEEGKAFFTREVIQFKGDPANPGKAIACVSCHTANPADKGRHIVTDKKIAPLSPVVNARRFADMVKVEKAFAKHCNEVVGSDCTPAEKASYITYLLTESTPTKK